jgi:hypothetical protein
MTATPIHQVDLQIDWTSLVSDSVLHGTLSRPDASRPSTGHLGDDRDLGSIAMSGAQLWLGQASAQLSYVRRPRMIRVAGGEMLSDQAAQPIVT